MKKVIFFSVMIVLVACSSTKTVVQVKNDNYKNLVPLDGKSIVYFVRPTILGTIIPIKIYCNDSLIGYTKGNKYLFTILESKKYKFVSEAENKAEFELQTEPNKIYYIEQKILVGLIIARNQLILLPENEGKEKLAKCSLSKWFTPPKL